MVPNFGCKHHVVEVLDDVLLQPVFIVLEQAVVEDLAWFFVDHRVVTGRLARLRRLHVRVVHVVTPCPPPGSIQQVSFFATAVNKWYAKPLNNAALLSRGLKVAVCITDALAVARLKVFVFKLC